MLMVEYALVIMVESRHHQDEAPENREDHAQEVFRIEVDQMADRGLAERMATRLALMICMEPVPKTKEIARLKGTIARLKGTLGRIRAQAMLTEDAELYGMVEEGLAEGAEPPVESGRAAMILAKPLSPTPQRVRNQRSRDRG